MTGASGGPVRIGIIGCGGIARWAHLRTLRHLRGATLVAAADPDPAARRRVAHLVRGPVHEHPAELLERDDVDAVIISAPTPLHAGLTIAAAGARKHAYIEKPLATTSEDARAAIDAMARAGVVSVVGFNYRHHPAHQRARALLREGRIGAILAVHTAFCEPALLDAMPTWKRQRHTGGGVLLDLASHHVDLLRWFLDDEVALVSARIASDRTEHDGATLGFTMRSGLQVQTSVSFRAGPVDFLEFIGESGTLTVDRHALSPTLRCRRRLGYGLRSVWLRPTGAQTALWLRRLAQPSYQPSFRLALAAFVQRIHGAPVSLPTLEDGARSLAVVLAAEESARTFAPVSIP